MYEKMTMPIVHSVISKNVYMVIYWPFTLVILIKKKHKYIKLRSFKKIIPTSDIILSNLKVTWSKRNVRKKYSSSDVGWITRQVIFLIKNTTYIFHNFLGIGCKLDTKNVLIWWALGSETIKPILATDEFWPLQNYSK